MPKLNPIKWSGSKAYCADRVLSKSDGALHYCEPFVGSGAVFLRALEEPKFKTFYVSDTCAPLIALWLAIRDDSRRLCDSYAAMWGELSAADTDDDKKDVYLRVRDRFNFGGDPADFLFLLRTCFNGLVRFNASGGFNSPFHHNRPGAAPQKLATVVTRCSDLMRARAVRIELADYSAADVRESGFTFLDPPYGGGGSKMYSGGFDHPKFLKFAQACPGRVAVTLSSIDDGPGPGFRSEEIKSKGSFKKLVGSVTTDSTEILYWK